MSEEVAQPLSEKDKELATKVFHLLQSENASSLISRDQWLTPYDTYSQFIYTVKEKFKDKESFKNYLLNFYGTEVLDEALTPEVMFDLALTSLTNLFLKK